MRSISLLLGLILAAPLAAQADDDPSPYSEARLVADADAVRPGTSIDVALRLDLEDGWHSYWINPGDSGIPVALEWTAGGAMAGPLQYPYPERLDIEGLASYAYEGSPLFLTRIAVPDDATGTLDLEADATWLVCEAICLPARQTVSLSIPIGEPTTTDVLEDARARLPVKAPGWTANAAATQTGYVLTLGPPDDWSGDLEGAQFFVADKGVVDHPAVQVFREEGGAWAVELASSPFSEEPTDRLRGVLVAADGQTFEDGARALEVDTVVAQTSVAGVANDQESELTLWGALAFAFLGGVILNLMPCVFPVLSLKILGFVQGREDDRATLRRHGLVFAAGVVVSFLVLAGALLALRAAGAGIGWGFQLQSPPIVAGLAILMVVLGLNLVGVFEVGHRVMTAGARLDKGEGIGGAFWSGVLATIVAAPCTAPLMGAALGFAVAQPAGIALAVFATLGIGMALPYVVLSFNPALLDRLPRPGPWMETLKQALAFPLFATAVWLVWVFGLQTGMNGAGALLMALVAVGLAAWLWGRWPAQTTSKTTLAVVRVLALVAVVGAVALVVTGSSQEAQASTSATGGWEPFEAESVETLIASGEPVFIDFTAAWCLTCQVNKKTSLNTAAVEDAFEDGGITTVRADWTNYDPAITAYLDRFGRSGVPLYVYYPGGSSEPVLLPAVLTPQIVLEAVGAQTASL